MAFYQMTPKISLHYDLTLNQQHCYIIYASGKALYQPTLNMSAC